MFFLRTKEVKVKHSLRAIRYETLSLFLRLIFTYSSSILESLLIDVIPSGPLQIALNAIVFVIRLIRKESAMYVSRYVSMVASFTPKSFNSVCLSQFSSLQSYRMVHTWILLPDLFSLV